MDEPSVTSWAPFEHFILRATGMPFEWLLRRGDRPIWELDREAYGEMLSESRELLWKLTQDPLFQEAVFMSNPQVHALLETWHGSFQPEVRTRKERKRERTLYRFLTRFAAKNDTTSFFGATSVGQIEKKREGYLRLPIADVRRTFLEHWAADAVLEAIADDLGTRPPDGGIPVGHPRVCEFIATWLSEQPDSHLRNRWAVRLNELEQRLQSFSYAPLNDRLKLFQDIETDFRCWTNAQARRGEGAYYSSKTVLHEVGDRSGDVVGLTHAERKVMREGPGPFMEFCALHVLVERLKTRSYVQAALGDREVSFAELTSLLSKAGPDYHLAASKDARALYREIKDIRTHLRRRVDVHLSERNDSSLELLDNEVASFLEHWADALTQSGRAYTNPDLLLARGEHPTLVLGDMHAMPFLTPAAFAAAPSEEDVWDSTRRFLTDLCTPEQPAFLTHARPSFVAYVPDLGEVALEIDGRAAVPDPRRSAFESLRVRLVEGHFRYTARNLAGKELSVMPLTRAANTMSQYSKTLQQTARVYPVRLLELGRWLADASGRSLGELPRLTFGGIVVHRKCWEVRSQAWAAPGCEVWNGLQKLSSLCNGTLPRFCFVKGEGDPKPLLVDFADPISSELLLWMARNQPSLTLHEMLPGPESLWLEGPTGSHTSELRCVYVR